MSKYRQTPEYKETFNLTFVQLMYGVETDAFLEIAELLAQADEFESALAIQTAVEQFKAWDGGCRPRVELNNL
jgi:hypothetical protein